MLPSFPKMSKLSLAVSLELGLQGNPLMEAEKLESAAQEPEVSQDLIHSKLCQGEGMNCSTRLVIGSVLKQMPLLGWKKNWKNIICGHRFCLED